MTESIRQLSTEAFLSEQVDLWHNSEEEDRDLVARNFLCGLCLYIERAEKMIPILAKAHLKSLYAKWKQFCTQTEIDLGDNDVERYDEALFGSAIISLNSGKGKAFVIANKMIWSKACIEQFNDWVNYVDDEYSAHYKEWVR